LGSTVNSVCTTTTSQPTSEITRESPLKVEITFKDVISLSEYMASQSYKFQVLDSKLRCSH
jgi:hypothetical protein